MANTKISPPWVGYYHKLVALFGSDPDITIGFDDKKDLIKLFVRGADKANALAELLPTTVMFGKVTLKMEVVPSNMEKTTADIIRDAFEGNPLFDDVFEIHPEGSSNPFVYVMFKPKVVQYWNDNLADPHGNVTTLAQDLAMDVLDTEHGLFYSTTNPSIESI